MTFLRHSDFQKSSLKPDTMAARLQFPFTKVTSLLDPHKVNPKSCLLKQKFLLSTEPSLVIVGGLLHRK